MRCGAACVCAALTLFAAAPARGGPPYRTDDPEPVDVGHFEINMFSLGSDASPGWGGLLPGVEVNYGAFPGLQLHVIVQQGYEAPAGGDLGVAFADVELGAKFRFLNPGDDDWYPEAGVFPTVEIPTGNPRLALSTGHAQVYLPLWLQKDFKPWSIFGGGGYWINSGAGNSNYGFFGVGVTRQVSEPLNIGIELFHQTETGATASTTLQPAPGLGVAAQTGFNVGLVYDFSKTWHLLASAGTGLQNRDTTNRFSYYLALQLTF